ncbi:MAG: hypothetical protein V3W41_03485 [Planctomycetota bacterium]
MLTAKMSPHLNLSPRRRWCAAACGFVGLVLWMILGQGCASPKIGANELERSAAQQLRDGKVDESLKGFRKALAADPNSLLARVGIANCHARKGDSVRFEAAAIGAAAAAPRSVEGWFQVGIMYVQGAERFRRTPRSRIYAELGVGYLRSVFATEPNRRGLIESLGVGLILKEDARTAVLLLAEAHRRQPLRLELTHAYLVALRKTGSKKEARRVLAKLQSSRGDLPANWRALSHWAESDDGDEAAGS